MFAEIRQLHALKTTALSNWYGAALPPLRHARRRRCSSASPQNRAHVVCSAGLLTGDSRTAVCRDVVITPTVSKGWEGPVRMDKYSDSQDEAAQVCRLTCRPPHKAAPQPDCGARQRSARTTPICLLCSVHCAPPPAGNSSADGRVRTRCLAAALRCFCARSRQRHTAAAWSAWYLQGTPLFPSSSFRPCIPSI